MRTAPAQASNLAVPITVKFGECCSTNAVGNVTQGFRIPQCSSSLMCYCVRPTAMINNGTNI